MPFSRPTLKEISDRISADVNSRLTGADSFLRRSVLNVLIRALSGVIDPDFKLRNVFNVNQTGNLILNDPAAGKRPAGNDVRVNFIQDGTGGHSIAWGPGYTVKGSWSTGPNAINSVVFNFDIPNRILARIENWEAA